MDFWNWLNRRGGSLLTASIVCVGIAGFALVGSAPTDSSPLANAGTGVALFAIALGIGRWVHVRHHPRAGDDTERESSRTGSRHALRQQVDSLSWQVEFLNRARAEDQDRHEAQRAEDLQAITERLQRLTAILAGGDPDTVASLDERRGRRDGS
jgi:hypothetical protein